MFLKISRNFKKTFSIFAFSLLIFAIAATALAVDYQPLVSIPGINAGASLKDYLSGLYNFLISIVGILAMGVIIYGGMRYIVSAGNPAAMEDAKETIMSAVYGLALALGSWLIINVVNPDILVLKNPGVGLPVGTYAAKESSTLRCFDNPGNPDVYDPNEGTQANPCTCLDGTPQYSTKTRASITLNVSPASVSIGGTVTASGKLTDASGAGIGGKSINIIVSNAAVNGSGLIPSAGGLLDWLGLGTTITTDSGGNFSIPLGPSRCVATEQWQAVFQGDTTYLPTGSGIVSVTTNSPGTSCAQGDYPGKTVATFMSPSTCQNLCSNKNAAYDGMFHCLAPKLGVGRTAEDALSGMIQTIDNPPATTNEPIFFDATSNTKTGFPIGEIDVGYVPGWIDWLTGSSYNYQCALNGGCAGSSVTTCDPQSGDKLWPPPYNATGKKEGKFTHIYSNAGTYPVILKIGVKMPDGTCQFKTESNVIIKVQ